MRPVVVPVTRISPLIHPVRHALRWAVSALAIGYISIATFPGGYFPVQAGLDLSWVYAINWLAETPHRFGREVNFTYGPLGFLFLPTNFGEHVLWSALFRLFSAIAFAAALALLRPIAWCLVLFGIFFGVAAAFGLPLEMQLLVTIALWAWLSLRKDSTVLLAATGAIAAPLVLVKFNLEAAIFSTVFTAAGLHALAARSARWRKFGIPVAAHLFSALLCCVLVLSPGSVLPWFRASVEMASGYSASMSFVPDRPRAALGALICVVLALAAMALARARSSSAVLCALLAGPLFLAFKAGYVREDGHVLVFYGFATGAAASIFLGAKTTRPMAIAGITSAIVVSLSLTGLSAGRLLQLEAMGPILAGRQGYTFLQHALHAGDIKRSLDANPVKGLAPDRLPDVELQAIGNAPVAVIPWELSMCAANHLDCEPVPTLQTYCAYTPYLDELLASFYRAPAAPPWLVVHTVGSIDGRHVLLDDPRAAVALLERYRPGQLQPPPEEGAPLLLRNRGFPAPLALRPIGTGRLRLGEWTSIPQSRGIVLAALDFSLTPRGRLARLLHRIPPVELELRGPGAASRHRILPETSGGGLLVGGLPLTLSQFARLLAGAIPPKAREFRIAGSGTRFYRQEVPVRWFALEVPHDSDAPSIGR